MWWRFFWWIVSIIISDLLREKLPAQTPSGIGDFAIPTATEGRSVPFIPGGTPRIRAPNCIWYGDFAAVPRTTTTGVILREEEVIGFNYELALQYALFKGQGAGLTAIWIGDDKVFDHVVDNGGVPATVVDIDRNDLFGGKNSGGGFVGRVRFFNGAEDQAVSSFLASRVTNGLPAYRGTAYVMITDLTETKGADIGEANNLRYFNFEVQMFDDVAGTAGSAGLGDVLGLGNDHHFIGPDANPISVAYDLYINQRWGRRFAVSDVNLANFKAAAELAWTEGIGYTQLIDEQTTTEAINDTLEQHIDGYIGPNPITGQIEVTLARLNYTLSAEFQADPSNIRRVKKWNKGDWSQTFNRVRLRYSDRDKDWNETHAIATSPANRIIQGKSVTKEVRYQGVHTASVANIIVARTNRALAQPIESGTVEIDRTAYQLRPGSVFSFTWPKVKATDLPVRITKADVGNTIKNTMIFEVIEDVFDNELPAIADPPDTDFVPPIQTVVAFAVADQAALEAPFVISQYDQDPGPAPRVLTLARITGGAPTQYEVIRRTRTPPTGFSGAYTSTDDVAAAFMTCGELRNAEIGWQSGNGGLSIQIDPIGAESLDGLIDTFSPSASSAAGIAVIDPGLDTEEWLAFDAIVDDLGGISLENTWRACCDTHMNAHSIGDRVWFIWTGGLGLGPEIYTQGDGVDVKLLPKSPNDAIDEAGATSLPEISLATPAERTTRPLVPAVLDFNGSVFPTTDVDFDTSATGGPGLDLVPTIRLWRTQAIVDSVNALNVTGSPIGAADLADQVLRISVWIYNLDTDPTPARGDAVATVIDQAVTDQGETVTILRSALISGGITVDFAARLELEMKHSPPGEAANQVSRDPLFFDFSAIGTWV